MPTSYTAREAHTNKRRTDGSYYNYTSEPAPEAHTDKDITSFLEEMANNNSSFPGFVIRSAGQDHKQALRLMREKTEDTPLRMTTLTIYRNHSNRVSSDAFERIGPADPDTDHYDQPRLQGLYVSVGALAIETFRPGHKMEAAFSQRPPANLPDEVLEALSLRFIHPDWLQDTGDITHTTLGPQDLGIYRQGSVIIAARPIMPSQITAAPATLIGYQPSGKAA